MLRPLRDLHLALVFLTRLPLPSLPGDLPPLARTMWAFPLVGAVVGLLAGTAVAAAEAMGLTAGPASLLGIAVAVLVTGALHEDGLADVADAFGSGAPRARKLEIMRDSRIGTYGGVALVLALGLRWTALADMLSPMAALGALVLAHAFARASQPLTMTLLRPARADGLGASAGAPPAVVVVAAVVLAAGLAAVLAPDLWMDLTAAMLAATLVLALLAQRAIGGYTGDVIGATTVVVEIAVLLVLLGAS